MNITIIESTIKPNYQEKEYCLFIFFIIIINVYIVVVFNNLINKIVEILNNKILNY